MSDTTSDASKCPVDFETRSLWSFAKSSKSPSVEEAAKHAQTPHPHQRLPLSTHRKESTIPKSSTSTRNEPMHQMDANSAKWVYPSEQQVFNAMKRKGWQGIEEESIPSFLQIHNSVNERSWQKLQEWEDFAPIELSRFEGRPKDLTPKAWFYSWFGEKPFDRHDWYVVHTGETLEKTLCLGFLHDRIQKRQAQQFAEGGD